jgi:SPX domain protein involved in polyphosphate accumulation
MAARVESYRYERKFLVPANSWATIEPGIKHNPGIFSSLYHPRTVNNIYLDSPALRLYFMNLEGAAERTKVRIRWYGDLRGLLPHPTLEFKSRSGLLGQKHAFPLDPFQLDNSFTGELLRGVLQGSDLPDGVRQLLSDLEPTLVNCYRRHYYQSADRKYRLTLDSGLEFFRVRPGHNAWLCKTPHCPFQVVELKYDQAHANGADEIAAAFPFRVTRMSKYVFGLDSLDGY